MEYEQPSPTQKVTALDLIRPKTNSHLSLSKEMMPPITVGSLDQWVRKHYPGWMPERFYTA